MDNQTNLGHVQIAGLPWFSREDYESFRRLLPDRSWHATFDQWQAAAEKTIHELENRRDIRVVKAHVQSDAFAQWCRATGRDINTQALLAYGNEFAARQFLEQNSH